MAFTALSMAGYATPGLLSYHLQVRHVVPAPMIPVLYVLAMGAATLAPLASGRLYDRIELRAIGVAPLLAAVVPFSSFSKSPALVSVGAGVWGLVIDIHESTMWAAVADLVPTARRDSRCRIFTAVCCVRLRRSPYPSC